MTESNRQIDVSVVVVNWNVPALLDACLTSIEQELAGSQLDVEVMVVDNQSTIPGHVDVVAAHPEARLVELDENRGYGAACNVGIGLAQGRAILLLNPDTELLPGSLDRMWRTLRLSQHIGLVAPLLLNGDRTLQSAGYSFPGVVNVLFDLFPIPDRLYGSRLNGRRDTGDGRLPVAVDYALGAVLFARRSALLDVGMFDEEFFMYSEEVDLQRRLAAHGWTRLLDPSASVIHHGGQSTGQQPENMTTALWESRARYFRRWESSRKRAVMRFVVEFGTWLDDRRRPSRRRSNATIRQAFRAGRSGRA